MDPNQIKAKLDFVQAEAGQAYQKVSQFESRLLTVAADVSSSKYLADSAMKANDTTQKLLKALINEIKDLREEGKTQQEQIDVMRQEMDSFEKWAKDEISRASELVRESGGGARVNPIQVTWNQSEYGYGTQCWDLVDAFCRGGSPATADEKRTQTTEPLKQSSEKLREEASSVSKTVDLDVNDGVCAAGEFQP